MADLTVEELLASREVVLEFWRALVSDDDLSARRLYYPPSLALAGLGAGKITAEIRAGLSLSIEECRAMAFSATGRILPDGDGGDAVAWLATRSSGRIELFDEPTQVMAWALVAYRRRPSDPWLVWGTANGDLLSQAHGVDLMGHVLEAPEGGAGPN